MSSDSDCIARAVREKNGIGVSGEESAQRWTLIDRCDSLLLL